MFYCQKCKKLTQPGEPQKLVVVETRPKQYRNHKNEIVGDGTETVREMKMCAPCAQGEGK